MPDSTAAEAEDEAFEPWYTLELDVVPEQIGAFLGVMLPVVATSRQEAGVLQYDLLRDRAAPHRFNLVQRYRSIEDVREHMAKPGVVAALEQLGRLLSGPYVQTDYGRVDG